MLLVVSEDDSDDLDEGVTGLSVVDGVILLFDDTGAVVLNEKLVGGI